MGLDFMRRTLELEEQLRTVIDRVQEGFLQGDQPSDIDASALAAAASTATGKTDKVGASVVEQSASTVADATDPLAVRALSGPPWVGDYQLRSYGAGQ